jgi:hypothetical protein
MVVKESRGNQVTRYLQAIFDLRSSNWPSLPCVTVKKHKMMSMKKLKSMRRSRAN